MAIVKGRLGGIYMAKYGAGATPFTAEATTANTAKTVFTITDQHKRFIDPDTALVVKYDGSVVTDYASVQYPGGIVTWGSTPGSAAVTLGGSYLPVVQVGECRSWTLDFNTEFVDITSFGDNYRRQMAMITQGTANIEGMYVDSTLFTEMISTNPRIGIDLFLDTTTDAAPPITSPQRYTGYGTMGTTSMTASIEGVVEQPFVVNFSDGPFYVLGLTEALA